MVEGSGAQGEDRHRGRVCDGPAAEVKGGARGGSEVGKGC